MSLTSEITAEMMMVEMKNRKLISSEITMSWAQYFASIYYLSHKVPKTLKGEKVYVGADTPLKGLLCMGALIHAKAIPVLGSKSLLRQDVPLAQFEYADFDISLEDLIESHELGDLQAAVAGFFAAKDIAIAFSTSGSLGKGLIIPKSWSSLILEVYELRKILSLRDSSKFLSLIAPFHIYGFLYTFLLPLIVRADIQFARLEHGNLLLNETNRDDIDLFIMVPALWPLVRSYITEKKVSTIVTSGAAVGAAREREFLNLGLSTDLIEVFGSTETGGVGYRWIAESEDGRFKVMEGISLRKKDNKIFIKSPFLYPPRQEFECSDDFELFEDGRFFRYLQRKDRIFKLKGHRYSLIQIEDNLKKLTSSTRVKCFFEESSPLAKGGKLYAFCEAPPFDIIQMRERYTKVYDTPFPNFIHCLKTFPTDANGKITLSALMAVVQKNKLPIKDINR